MQFFVLLPHIILFPLWTTLLRTLICGIIDWDIFLMKDYMCWELNVHIILLENCICVIFVNRAKQKKFPFSLSTSKSKVVFTIVHMDISGCWTKSKVVACVCGFWVVWICNPLIELIQGCFVLNPFEKYVFSKRRVKSTSCFIISTGCFTLSGFVKGFEKFDFDVKPIQLVVSKIQPIVFWKSLTEFSLLWLTLLSKQFNRLFRKFSRLFFENP